MKSGLLLRLEVEALLVEWGWRVDEGRAASAADLFCEDAEQTLLGVKTTGLEAIRAGFQRRQDIVARSSQHSISNVRIVNATDELVEAQWVVTMYRSDSAQRTALPFLIGSGRDLYRRGADGELKVWRREVNATFGG